MWPILGAAATIWMCGLALGLWKVDIGIFGAIWCVLVLIRDVFYGKKKEGKMEFLFENPIPKEKLDENSLVEDFIDFTDPNMIDWFREGGSVPPMVCDVCKVLLPSIKKIDDPNRKSKLYDFLSFVRKSETEGKPYQVCSKCFNASEILQGDSKYSLCVRLVRDSNDKNL
jgi:hypothetical protein